ncbi:UNVERIFIED_CONTAM: hypothetical protein FKN15_078114 [Acipenser sinensis]
MPSERGLHRSYTIIHCFVLVELYLTIGETLPPHRPWAGEGTQTETGVVAVTVRASPVKQ